ncbi:MAG: hypothetical protein LBL63_00795, partial [Clostridiales Family XIII bacterium]|nr:hypothetical protein [Clostridiales Family XIII bacterium]
SDVAEKNDIFSNPLFSFSREFKDVDVGVNIGNQGLDIPMKVLLVVKQVNLLFVYGYFSVYLSKQIYFSENPSPKRARTKFVLPVP